MGFVMKLILGLILGGVVIFFTGNTLFGAIAFVIFLILGMLLFRKKSLKKPQTPEQMEAFRILQNKKRGLNDSFSKGTISKQDYANLVKGAERDYERMVA